MCTTFQEGNRGQTEDCHMGKLNGDGKIRTLDLHVQTPRPFFLLATAVQYK